MITGGDSIYHRMLSVAARNERLAKEKEFKTNNELVDVNTIVFVALNHYINVVGADAVYVTHSGSLSLHPLFDRQNFSDTFRQTVYFMKPYICITSTIVILHISESYYIFVNSPIEYQKPDGFNNQPDFFCKFETGQHLHTVITELIDKNKKTALLYIDCKDPIIKAIAKTVIDQSYNMLYVNLYENTFPEFSIDETHRQTVIQNLRTII